MNEKGHNYEIIVIDDGSCDGTKAVAERFQQYRIRTIRNDRNRGKGFGGRHGMLEAKKSLVLFSDADLSPPNIIDILNIIYTI
jgi:glycosyltransferase involved in cell wall biosynthesis